MKGGKGKMVSTMNEKIGEVFSIAQDNPPIEACTISKTVLRGANDITYFSLAPQTDISPEIHPYHKLLILAEGSLEVYGQDGSSCTDDGSKEKAMTGTETGTGAEIRTETGTDDIYPEAGAHSKTSSCIKTSSCNKISSYKKVDFCKTMYYGDSMVTAIDVPLGMRSAEGAIYTEITIRREDIMNEAIKAGEVFKLADLVPYAKDRIVNMDVVHNDKMKFVVMAFDEGTGLTEHAAPGEALVFALDGEAVIGYEGKEHPIQAGENFHFAKGGLHTVQATKQFKMALLLTLE